MHPPSGGHSGKIDGLNDLHRSALNLMDTLLRSECLPEPDFRDDVEVPGFSNNFQNHVGNGCALQLPVESMLSPEPTAEN